MRLLVFLVALIYIISPLDFIPDVIPLVGWLDDLAALLIGISTLLGGRDRPRLGPS